MPQSTRSLDKVDFEALSEFRYQMRRFERFSEDAARAEGVTPLQYLLLLHLKGFPGRPWATVGELAQRLQIKPHSAVALITRCEAIELVERRPSSVDRRQVEVHLRKNGEQLLRRVATLHRAELRSLEGSFRVPQIDAESMR